MKEKWKKVPGFDGYKVSDQGRVMSCRYGQPNGLHFGPWRFITPKFNGRKTHLIVNFVNRAGKRRSYSFHRILYELFVGPIPDGMLIDHKDRNGLNNCLDNLRLCTSSQNNVNQRHRKGRKYKGVTLMASGKWKAVTSYKGKQIRLGLFLTEIEAAKAYNDYARKTFGEFAVLNIIPDEVN